MPAGLARQRYDDLALLTVTSLAFALGACSAEGTKHLIAAQAGPLAGIARLPHLRTLRPRLAAIADGCDPLGLQRRLAAAMLAADAPGLEVYYVDDHFVPYEGAKPVPKGWNTKRRHAQKGRADTVVTDYHGRAVCFASGDPSGLTATMAGVLGQLREVTGPGKKIMLGFDRGGSYPQVFTAVRQQDADWITWRRGPLTVPAAAPRRCWAAHADGKPAEVLHLADETVTIRDYGQCRQITLFEDGTPVLQVLTSDLTAPAAALLAWLRCRWRIENLFKYLEDHYGIHWLCDYDASLQDDGHLIDNPARKAGRARLAKAGDTLAAAERDFAALLTSPALSAAAKNAKIPAAQKKIAAAQDTVATAKAALDQIPAKLPGEPGHPRRTEGGPADPPPRPADGAAAAGRQRRGLARAQAQRLPARQRRIPGHHPQPAPPRRHHRLHPRNGHRHPRHPRLAPHYAGPSPAHRRTHHHPAADPRRPAAHHLPVPLNVTRQRRPATGDLSLALSCLSTLRVRCRPAHKHARRR